MIEASTVPPPAYYCVQAASAEASQSIAYLTVSGDPAQVGAFLAELPPSSRLKVDADALSNGVRFSRLTGPGNLEYREIGGIIFAAQHRRLGVAFTAEPPICQDEEQ